MICKTSCKQLTPPRPVLLPQTYASLTRGFAFAVLLGLMVVKKHARGVSMKSLQLYIVVFASRLVSVLQHEGYLPYDRSG